MQNIQNTYSGKTMLDCFKNITSSSMSIPIGVFMDASETTLVQIGFSLSGILGIQNLDKMGIYDYGLMENLAKRYFKPTNKLTGQWMDLAHGRWHRIKHGHSLDNIISVIRNPDLSVTDFFKHLATDIVTKDGLPLPFGKEIVQYILSITGGEIYPWVTLNLLDIGASAVSVWHAGKNIISVYNGAAQWGFNYALDTFGVGVAEITSGYLSSNPILVGSGAADCVCGSITAYNYYTQPMLFGVLPIKDIFGGAACGVALSALFSCVEIYMRRNGLSNSEKIKILGKNALESGIFGALGAISMPVSITASASYAAIQSAMSAAEKENEYIAGIPITSNMSSAWLHEMAANAGNGKETEDIMQKMVDIRKAVAKNGFN